MNKKRIYSVIESKKRELDSRILFALSMIEKGFSVGFGKKQNLYQYSKYMKKGLFLLKSIGPRNLKTIVDLKKDGHQVSSWDEEGFVQFGEEFTKLRNNDKCLQEIDYLYAWGENKKKNLLNFFPQCHKKIIPTGHPRFDLLKMENRSIFESNAQKIKEKFGKFILVATKFPIGNSVIENFRSKHHEAQLKLGVKNNFDQLDKKFQKETMEILIKTLESLTEKCPDINIIVRPHPGENIFVWNKIFNKHKNIRVIQDQQNTCCWIMASQFLISTNCHTSIESYLLGKQSINFAPIQNKDVEFDIFKKVSHNIEDPTELIDTVKKSVEQDYYLNLKSVEEDYLSKQIANLKVNSFNLMLDTIELSLKKMKDTNDEKCSNFYFLIFKLLKKIKNFKNNLFAKKELLLLSEQKVDFITLKEIKEKIKNYPSKFNIKEINISEKYPGVFIFERN